MYRNMRIKGATGHCSQVVAVTCVTFKFSNRRHEVLEICVGRTVDGDQLTPLTK